MPRPCPGRTDGSRRSPRDLPHRGGSDQAEQHADRRRLAGAVRARRIRRPNRVGMERSSRSTTLRTPNSFVRPLVTTANAGEFVAVMRRGHPELHARVEI